MSSMDNAFKRMLDGLRQADEARDEIMRGLEAAWTARRDLDDQLMELRESVEELKGFILQQGAEIRSLQGRLNDDHTTS